MEDVLLNIDSKYRDLQLYPNENKFRINLDKSYKNIVSAKIVSIEINNTLTYLSDVKNNNFIKVHLPNKINDPEGIILKLPRGLYQSITSIQNIYNAYFSSAFNNNNNLNNISKERYFYIFYLNNSVTINFKRQDDNIVPIIQEGEYINTSFNTDLGNLIIPAGWHSLYGLTVQIQNYLKTLTIPYGIFKMSAFSLRIWDRRFRKPNDNDDNIRIDVINEFEVIGSNLTENLSTLKSYIYFQYINDTTNFITDTNNNGIIDRLIHNTFTIPNGYTRGGVLLQSGSKYHVSNSKVAAPTGTNIQLYNLSMVADFTRVLVYFRNNFNNTTTTFFYYYFIDATSQGWNKVDTNNNQVNLLSNLGVSNLSKDIPQYQIDFNTYNTIESAYSNNDSIFDVKKMRYPTLGFYLGFRNNDYISNNENADQTIYAEKIFDTTGDDYLFIKINDWGHFDFFGQRILGKILMTTALGSPKLEDYISKEYRFKQPVNVQRLDIELVDYLGNSVDLNGFDFSFTLELKQITHSELKNDFENKIFHK